MRKKHSKLISLAAGAAILLTSLPGLPVVAAPADGDDLKPLKLQYFSPADKGSNERNNWERWALPIGNGHMGAMVFGRTETERIQMNEKTLWSGGTEGEPGDSDGTASDAYGNVDAYASGAMEKYIDFLFDEYYGQSTAGNGPAQTGEMKILPNNRSALGDYQNFAEMYMDFGHRTEDTSNYRRELDLRNALSTVQYDYEGVTYTREMFANYPDNVMVYRITASEPDSIDMVLRPEIPDMTASGNHNKKVTKEGTVVADEASRTITMQGKIKNNDMKFAGLFHVETDGEVTADNSDAQKGKLAISDADSVEIYVTLATNYKNEFPEYRQRDPEYAINNATERMDKVLATEDTYNTIWSRHLEDYQGLFSRVELDFGGEYDENEETDRLQSAYNSAKNSGTQNHYLEELYFQYGRYLTIASSREGTLPSNLQGIWNDRAFPDWQADYHTNINLQMNYWPAFTTNLAECSNALVDYVESLKEPGTLTANKLFGTDANAWMVNCSANALGFTGNINSNASMAVTANAFILQNVYDYYEFTGDKAMLESRIYPMMTGACNFFLQTLQNGRSDADKDKLFMAPSFSSEQGPWTIGAFFDQQLIYILFQETLEAADELGIEDGFTKQLRDTMERLYPIQIGEDGQIKEWQQEGKYGKYEFNSGKWIGNDNGHHRHNSQLMVLHPGTIITTETPELMQAAVNTLNLRGDDATGWSMGQKFNMWARLQDGDRAYNKLFKNLMSSSKTATNLFDLHPPFQIDGNFGGTAGLAELLMQSHAGYVSILPALPSEIPSGSVRGLVAEGNFVVDLDWADGEATYIAITSRNGNRLSVKAGVIGSVTDTTTGAEVKDFVQEADGSVSFATEAGHTYQIHRGEAVNLTPVEKLVKEIEDKDILTYANTTETGEEFEEAFLACKRMAEQENYVNTEVVKSVERLEKALEDLELRDAKQYPAVIALHFLENAASLNYEGTETEDTWRQEIEYDRADLKEALLDGSKENAELETMADALVKAANKIGEYPSERMELYDLLKKARNIEQGTRTDEEWDAYFEKIDAYEVIFANPNADKKDLDKAYEGLETLLKTMEESFRITASAEGDGKISPSGKVTVLGGGSQKFTMTPDEGNEILDVLVDDKSVGAVAEHTVSDVNKDMEVKAIFQKTEELKTEAEILLDNAIAKAEKLDGNAYTSETWNAVAAALENAKAADRTDEEVMKASANALLDAMDALESYGEPIRTEAESSNYWPVPGYNQDSVFKNPENWGEKDFPDGVKIIGGYAEGGPTTTGYEGKPNTGSNTNGKWDVQTVKNPSVSGDRQMFTKSKGAWVKFKFDGTRVRYIAEVSTGGALADVYIDDVKVAQVECWNASNYRNYVAFDSADYDINLSEGSHVLKLVCVGQPPNQSNPIFRVDAFDEYTTVSVVATKELAEAVAKASALNPAAYTAESWDDMQTALDAAKAVLDASESDQAVADALTALEESIDALVAAKADIIKVTEFVPVEVPYETTAEELEELLPTSVVVETENLKKRVDVEWNMKDFDGEKAGKCTLKGELLIPEDSGITNADDMQAEISVTVRKGEAKITLENLKQTEGDVKAVKAVTDPKGLKVKILYDGLDILPDKPGSYHVTATVVDDNYEGMAEGTLVIEKKTPVIPDPGPTDPDPEPAPDPEPSDPTKPGNDSKPSTDKGNGGNGAVQTGDTASGFLMWGVLMAGAVLVAARFRKIRK